MGQPSRNDEAAKELESLFEATLDRAGQVEQGLRRVKREVQSFMEDRDVLMDEGPHSPESAGAKPREKPKEGASLTRRSKISSGLEAFERGKRGYRSGRVRRIMKSERKRMKGESEQLQQRKNEVVRFLISLQYRLDGWKDDLQRNLQFGVLAVLADYASKKDGDSKGLGLDELNERKDIIQSLTNFLSSHLKSLG